MIREQERRTECRNFEWVSNINASLGFLAEKDELWDGETIHFFAPPHWISRRQHHVINIQKYRREIISKKKHN